MPEPNHLVKDIIVLPNTIVGAYNATFSETRMETLPVWVEICETETGKTMEKSDNDMAITGTRQNVVETLLQPMDVVVINDDVQGSPRMKNLCHLKDKEKWFYDGYDSDGELGSFYNVEETEGLQMFDKDVPTLDDEEKDGDGEDIEEVNIDEALCQPEVPKHVDINKGRLKR